MSFRRILIYSLIIFFVAPAAVVAQNVNINADEPSQVLSADEKSKKEIEADEILNDPGILPDSPLFVLKRWWEETQTFFTFGAERKAELQHRLALKRVAEAKKMIDKGKYDIAERHLDRYENHLQKFEDTVTKLKDSKSEKTDELIEKLELLQERQQSVLMEVYEQVPEQAQDSILNAIEKSSKGIENAIDKIQGSDEVQGYKRRLKNRLDDEVNDLGESVKDKVHKRLEDKGILESEDSDEEDVNHDTDSGTSNTNTDRENDEEEDEERSSGDNDINEDTNSAEEGSEDHR